MKYIKAICYVIFITLFFLSPIIFPVIGILGWFNDISIMLLIGGIFSVFYLLSIMRNIPNILFVIFATITIFSRGDSIEEYLLYASIATIIDFALNLLFAFFTSLVNKISKKQNPIIPESNTSANITWQEYLNKNFKPTGTTTDFSDISLAEPSTYNKTAKHMKIEQFSFKKQIN